MSLKIASRPLLALSDIQIELIHRASLRILEEVGVEIRHERALEIFSAAGAEVDRASRRVKIPSEMVPRAVGQAPASFILHARNEARSVEIGGNELILMPTGGPSMVADLESGRRPGSLDDQVNFIKLGQRSRLLDLSYCCVEAHELPVATRHLDYLYAALRYSDKPLAAMAATVDAAKDSLAFASLIAGGPDALSGSPTVIASINVDSPLRFAKGTVETILAFAEMGQPVNITPFILPGVMSPVTPAGSLAQQNAEVLAGTVLAQIVRPGTPIIYGSFGTVADMSSAGPVFGGGKAALMEVAAGQLAQKYRLPHRGMGLVSTPYESNAQAAWEKANCLWSLALSNTHLLLHAAGWVEGGITASYEQFVLDLEMLASMEGFLAGIAVDDESLAVDAVAQAGPGGSYLTADHTLRHFREEVVGSDLMEASYIDTLKEGADGLVARASGVWKRWLASYEEPPLDPGLKEAAAELVAKRKTGEPAGLAIPSHIS